jgi:hypothetical protein
MKQDIPRIFWSDSYLQIAISQNMFLLAVIGDRLISFLAEWHYTSSAIGG